MKKDLKKRQKMYNLIHSARKNGAKINTRKRTIYLDFRNALNISAELRELRDVFGLTIQTEIS